jgi:hypothetical protein
MRKQVWALTIISALMIAGFVVAFKLELDVQNLQGQLTDMPRLQSELATTKQELGSLQENYSAQQVGFMSLFVPQLETHLGAKPLYDSKQQHQNYLWVTGDITNKGYGIAYNAGLQVKIYLTNSSSLTNSTTINYTLGDLDAHNTIGIKHPFYVDGEIVKWELAAYCNQTR